LQCPSLITRKADNQGTDTLGMSEVKGLSTTETNAMKISATLLNISFSSVYNIQYLLTGCICQQYALCKL